MNLIKRFTASVTAFALLASASAVNFAGTAVYAEEENRYELSISKESYAKDSLKTLGEYEAYSSEKHAGLTNFSNIYHTDNPSPNINEDSMDNKVAEVKLSIDANCGIYISQFYLLYDEELTFAGCVYDENGKLSTLDGFKNTQLKVSSKYDKLIYNYDVARKDFESTGEMLTLLFILPDDYETGRKYEVGFDDYTAFDIKSWDNKKASFTGNSGYIMITDGEPSVSDTPDSTEPSVVTTTAAPETTTEVITTTAASETTTEVITTTAASETTTEAVTTTAASETTKAEVMTTTAASETTKAEVMTTTAASETTKAEVMTTTAAPETTTEAVTTTPAPVTTPAVTTPQKPLIDIVLNAEKDKVSSEKFEKDHQIKLGDNASIKVEVPEKMVYQGTDKVEYSVKLSDFDSETEYFEYAGFGLVIPDGFKIDPASVKTALNGRMEYYAPDSLEAFGVSTETGYDDANGGFVMFRGVDTRNADRDAELFSFVLEIPESADKYAYDITVASVFGRLTEKTDIKENGVIVPSIAFIDNGAGEQKYTDSASKLLTGIKGDVNLDHKVTQIDATIILKETLSLSVSGKSVLKDMINTSEAGDSAAALSRFLGNVDGTPDGTFSQVDSTYLLRAVLMADVSKTTVNQTIWDKVFAK